MRTKNKRLLSLISIFLFVFSLFNATISLKTYAYSNPALTQDIKVGLVSMANSTLTAVLNGNYKVNGTQFPSGTILNIKLINGLINVNGTDYTEVQFIPETSGNLLTLTSGTSSYKYLGSFLFKVISGKIVPINSIGIENYLKGVVGYEMSESFPIEALKAQAVAARNYALSKIGFESAKGYDFDDTPLYQVYKGYDGKLINSMRAVEETKGTILLYNDKLVEALYSAWHGGYTEDSVNVWGNIVPYLKSKQDSFENDPWPNGNRIFTNSQIDSTLKSKGYIFPTDTFIKLDLDSITKYASGRVANINIIYKDVTGLSKTKSITKDTTRTFLALPSNMYTVSYDSVAGAYTFSGKGNGHGLGMNQIGAKNRAAAGQTYEQILKFYYDSSYLQKPTYKASIGSFTVSPTQIYTGEAVNIVTQGTSGSGQYLYRYDILLNGVNVFNTQYSNTSSLSYKAVQPGNYEVIAYVKDNLSNLSYDESQSKNFSVVDKPIAKITSFTQSLDKSFVGQKVDFFVTSQGGSGVYQYKYVVTKDQNLAAQSDYSASASYSYTPQAAGIYQINVYMKDSLSNAENDTKTLNLTVSDYSASLEASINKTSTLIGQPIKVSALGSNGSGQGYLYKYEIVKNGAIVTKQDYSSEANYTYIPSSNGNYEVKVYVKDSSSSKEYDSIKSLGFTAYSLPQILGVKSVGSMYINRPVTITATLASGSNLGFQVTYEIYKDGLLVSQKNIGSASEFTFTPDKSGKYSFKIYVKDNLSEKSFDAVKTFDMDILPQPMSIKNFPVYKGMQGPAVTTIQTGLTKLGYSVGTIDGIFGSKTESAVTEFQKSVKLKPNGIVDTITFDAMNNALINKAGVVTNTY